MQLHPTRSTFHVAVAGAGAGRARRRGAAGARRRLRRARCSWRSRSDAPSRSSPSRACAPRASRWSGRDRRACTASARGGTVVLEAELRNRGARRRARRRPPAARVEHARGRGRARPSIDLPAGGARPRRRHGACARRVGRWGVHGLALEVRGTPLGGEGLYEVPLLFANPLGVEVLPAALRGAPRLAARRPRAPRRRARAAREPRRATGTSCASSATTSPGDPFKRIAWKASARRGRLLVREMEREERDVVWLVLDASVELWAGAPGRAPLDRVVDEVAALAVRHLARGDRVGLVVTASRLRSWIAPDRGAAHGARARAARWRAPRAASTPIAPSSTRRGRAPRRRARAAARPARPGRPAQGRPRRARAPRRPAPRARAVRAAPPLRAHAARAALRHYLAAFGIESPPRVDGERERAESDARARCSSKLATEKPRPSVVHVWAPRAGAAPRRRARRPSRAAPPRIEVRWSSARVRRRRGRATASAAARVATSVDDAVRVRARARRARAGERILRRLGGARRRARRRRRGAATRRSAKRRGSP